MFRVETVSDEKQDILPMSDIFKANSINLSSGKALAQLQINLPSNNEQKLFLLRLFQNKLKRKKIRNQDDHKITFY